MSKVKELLKTYKSLVWPVGIFIVFGMVSAFSQWQNSSLSQDIRKQSISTGHSMQRLKVWPSGQWEVEKERQDAHQSDANKVEFLARQSTERGLLSYEIFPEPKYRSGQIFDNFGREFRKAVDQRIVDVNGGDCPAQAELDKFIKSAAARRSLNYDVSQIDAAIEDNLCREKAQRAGVYVNPTDFDGYEFWLDYSFAKAKSREEAIRNCWYSQLAFWVIEDVFDTVASLNSESRSVLTAPVKRVLGLNFPVFVTMGKSRYVSKSTQDDQDALPNYLLSPKEGLVVPCTGRISDTDIDVIHFRVDFVVSAESVLALMKELCSAKQHRFRGWDNSQGEQVFRHNQITILQYSIDPVERKTDSTHRRYRYGEDAVVKLSLICEYVFDNKGYEQVKPQAVKDEVADALKEIKREATRRRRRR
jgi:hypothetical protein